MEERMRWTVEGGDEQFVVGTLDCSDTSSQAR